MSLEQPSWNPAFRPDREIEPLIPNDQPLESSNSAPTSDALPPTVTNSKPTYDAGHASHPSFARTVSQDISWGDDDELDPLFGPQEDQSISFPSVPPTHEPKENGVSGPVFQDEPVSAIASRHESQDAQISEQRFEEGLPLIASSEQAETESNTNGFFEEPGYSDNEDADFFQGRGVAEMTKQGEAIPPSLRRKSTAQVLESLDVAISSNDKVVITNDSTTSSQQPSGDQDDLAAMWEAALGDDGEIPIREEDQIDAAAFFDDEELLPDEESATIRAPEPARESHMSVRTGNASQPPPNLYNGQHFSGQAQQAHPGLPRAQSFADKTKGGYASPYDLPMDLSRPRRKQYSQNVAPRQPSQPVQVAPPPRSSSTQFSQASPSLNAQRPNSQSPTASSSFFEDLPMVPKARQSSTSARYAPQQNTSRPTSKAGPTPPPNSSYGLQGPERIDPYSQAPLPSSVAPSKSRYSPQPAQKSAVPPPSRYTVAAPLPHQPRTSSPLALPAKQASTDSANLLGARQLPRQESDEGYQPSTINRYAPRSASDAGMPPPPTRLSGPQHLNSTFSSPQSDPNFAPPRRSQTQSPGTAIGAGGGRISNPSPTRVDPFPRPASVHDPTSPTTSTMPHMIPSRPRHGSRTFSQSLSFKVPTDGRELDPLQRWKGCPVFSWSTGGRVVTSFPKETPMMFSGQAFMQRGLGQVTIKNVREVVTLPDHIAKFPGPLKSKAKKKEVLAWLSSRIEEFEREIPNFKRLPNTSDFHGERLLLWRTVRLLVEFDGSLQGTSELDQLARALITPESDFEQTQDNNWNGPQGEPTDPQSLVHLRKLLLAGEREKAVWYAADQRLWAHAMLLSSTLSRKIWKDVVREFVSKEVQNLGTNTESLAALYEVFAGNASESVDKLVHPSARLGMQVMTNSGKTPKDALEGLNKWRETLGLIVANKSQDDGIALVSLGKLLMSYNRVDAAHTCFIFGKETAKFGASDDPQSDFTLLGNNPFGDYSSDVPQELDSILLSEVYEYALSLSPTSTSSSTPHMQAYKLQHALILAENGYRSDSQNYCSSIASTIKSSTKVSPYFNPALISTLDNLIETLQYSPKDGSSSWVSKPSMEKVSGAFSSRFYSFVSGEDSGAASTASSKDGADVGPFSKIAGSTPPLTRNTSDADLYGAYTFNASPPQTMAFQPTNSKYAPSSNAYAPHQSSSFDMRREASSDSQNPYAPSNSSPAYGYSDTSHAPPATDQPHPTVPLLSSSYSPMTNGNQYQNQYNPSGLAQEYRPDQQNASANDGLASYNPPTSYEPPAYTPYVPEEESEENEAKIANPKKKSFMDGDEDEFAVRSAQQSSKAEKDREAEDNFRKAAEADAQRDKDKGEKKGWLSGWFAKKDTNLAPGPIKAKLGEESSFVYDPDLKKWVNKKGGSNNQPVAATPPPPKGPSPRVVSGPPSTGGSQSRPPSSLNKPVNQGSSFPARQDSAPDLGAMQSLSGNSTPARSESPAGPPILAPPSLPGSGPPSRPGTGISNASDIDDLLGPAGASRKGGTVKKGKKGRGYIDVMAK